VALFLAFGKLSRSLNERVAFCLVRLFEKKQKRERFFRDFALPSITLFHFSRSLPKNPIEYRNGD
jgi:hypothetical protein